MPPLPHPRLSVSAEQSVFFLLTRMSLLRHSYLKKTRFTLGCAVGSSGGVGPVGARHPPRVSPPGS